MARTMTSRGSSTAKKKICKKCGQTKELSQFYRNRNWKEQLGCDAWCKDCVRRCETKEQIREYFWENHRAWTEGIWDSAEQKAKSIASISDTYQKMNDERRKRALEQLTCQQVPNIMVPYYRYVDTSLGGQISSYAEAKERGHVLEEEDQDLKIYSLEFNGYFKPGELKYLQRYYEAHGGDDLETENLRDYVKKLAKASLQADKAQDDYAAGRCDISVVKDAITLFDMLSKSSNLAACKKQPGEGHGKSSWSEISYILETNGHPSTRKSEWEKDDVDKTIEEYAHIVSALGLNDT